MAIEEMIRRDWRLYTPAEQKLATYFLNHLVDLPFETAASIGERVAVSPMTVGRFLRKLGFADMRGVKEAMRTAGREGRAFEAAAYVPDPLKAKIRAMTDVYQLQETPGWSQIVTRLGTASEVHVASFDVGRYLSLGFAAFLQGLRPRVYQCDRSDGAYADVLLGDDPDRCLVLIDARRYSRNFRLLAEEAAARGVRTVILTDVYCHWARALSDDVLMIETEFGVRSLSMLQLLMELLLAAVASELHGAEARLDEILELREKFAGFADGRGAVRKAGPRG